MIEAMQKLGMLLSTSLAAREMASACADPYVARLIARSVLLDVDIFLVYAPFVNNALKREGKVSHQAHASIREKLRLLRRDYEQYYDTVRDSLSAHVQELPIDHRLEAWNAIDASSVGVLSDLMLEVFVEIANALNAHVQRNDLGSIPPSLTERLASYSTTADGIRINLSGIGLARHGVATAIATHTDTQKCERFLQILDSLRTLTDAIELDRGSALSRFILTRLFLVDAVSLFDNTFTDRPEFANAGISADPSLLNRWKSYGHSGHQLLEAFQRDEALELHLRYARNRGAAHFDPGLTTSQCSALVFESYVSVEFHEYVEKVVTTVWDALSLHHTTQRFQLHGRMPRVTAVRGGFASSYDDIDHVAAELEEQMDSMSKFAIRKQLDSNNGCIPACALSVLDLLDMQNLPTEEDIILAMTGVGSGFKQLATAMNGLVPSASVTVEIGPLREILATNLPSGPVLVAHHSSPGRAHCVVVTAFDDLNLEIHDPAAGKPDVRFEAIADFEAGYTGDCAIIAITP